MSHRWAYVEPRGTQRRRGRRSQPEIECLQADRFAEEFEPFGAYDLVSSQYLHLPPEVRELALHRLAKSLAPGGSLLVASHHPSDLEIPGLRPNVLHTIRAHLLGSTQQIGRSSSGPLPNAASTARRRPPHHSRRGAPGPPARLTQRPPYGGRRPSAAAPLADRPRGSSPQAEIGINRSADLCPATSRPSRAKPKRY
jgi:hypothetical protein